MFLVIADRPVAPGGGIPSSWPRPCCHAAQTSGGLKELRSGGPGQGVSVNSRSDAGTVVLDGLTGSRGRMVTGETAWIKKRCPTLQLGGSMKRGGGRWLSRRQRYELSVLSPPWHIWNRNCAPPCGEKISLGERELCRKHDGEIRLYS